MTEDDKNSTSEQRPGLMVSMLRVGLPLVFIAGAGFLAWWMLQTEPKAKRRPAVRHATLVKVTDVELTEEKTIIEAMGTVRPAKQVSIHPQVRGEVVKIGQELIPGGLLKQGQLMLRIDPSDYQLAIQEVKASVVQAESNLQMEQGSQTVAKKEFEMLGEMMDDADPDLVLRKPQLEKAKASLESTHAALDKAKLNLKRTTIKAPFNAVVQERQVDMGARVTESSTLATLIGTDAYWVEVSVPVDQLKWIDIPRTNGELGSRVRIYDEAAWGDGISREGHVLRLTAALEEKGRMARLITKVDDPLALSKDNTQKPQLLIGSYVRIQIDGANLESVVSVPRDLIRDGDNVWIMTKDNKLEIRKVNIAFQRTDRVFLSSGINPGEKLVLTDLSAPVEGMSLRTDDMPAPQADVKPMKGEGQGGGHSHGSGGGH